MATIHDVAAAAGVSPMTVSNVLNGYPHVRPSTRERVLEAIEKLDYRVNVAARNLRTGRTGVIGLAVPEIGTPYYGRLASEVIAAAARRGLRVAVEQTATSRESELDAIEQSRNRMYDGLLLSAVGLGPEDKHLLPVDFPVVVLGERIFNGPVSHVAMPNVEGARAVTAHLIGRGCSRIALICGQDEFGVSSLRREGYLQALDEAGLADHARTIALDHLTMRDAAAAAHRIADEEVDLDGIFCVTDTVAIGVLRGLADRGIRVPEDVRVAGFDNIDESEFTVPSLTTLDPDHAGMAAAAVDLLTERISNDGVAPVDFTSTPRVIERGSTV